VEQTIPDPGPENIHIVVPTTTPRPVAADILQRREEWLTLYRRWSAFYYVLGWGGAVGTIVVAAISKSSPPVAAAFPISILVAGCTTTVTFFKASAKAQNFILAFTLLDDAIQDYRGNPELPESHMRAAIKRGQAIITR
jgi:hypothetical protein